MSTRGAHPYTTNKPKGKHQETKPTNKTDFKYLRQETQKERKKTTPNIYQGYYINHTKKYSSLFYEKP